MNRILVAVLGLLFLSVIVSPLSAKAFVANGWSAHLPDGVYCEINDVRLFAKTPAECMEAGE